MEEFIITNNSIIQKEDNGIKEYFDEEEIIQLELLMDFVRNEITDDCKSTNADCVSKYFNQFEDLPVNATNIDFGISIEKERLLLNKIDENLFAEIWGYCEGSSPSALEDGRVNTKSLCLKSKGKFAELLVSRTNSKDTLKIYGEPFDITGDYSPAMNAILLKQSERFDLDTDIDFLLVTIHLLTLNYPVETVK